MLGHTVRNSKRHFQGDTPDGDEARLGLPAELAYPPIGSTGSICPWQAETRVKPSELIVARPLLKIVKMNTPFQFRSRLTTGGEIFAQQATILPVGPAPADDRRELYTPEMQHLAVYLPIFKIKGKKSAVAQPMLKEDLR